VRCAAPLHPKLTLTKCQNDCVESCKLSHKLTFTTTKQRNLGFRSLNSKISIPYTTNRHKHTNIDEKHRGTLCVAKKNNYFNRYVFLRTRKAFHTEEFTTSYGKGLHIHIQSLSCPLCRARPVKRGCPKPNYSIQS
jgi:hypothetical protein